MAGFLGSSNVCSSYVLCNMYAEIHSCNCTKNMTYIAAWTIKPSLSMKILSINNFTTRLLSKLFSDLYIGVHLKGTKKFGNKVINRQYFHRKTGLKTPTPIASAKIGPWRHPSPCSFIIMNLL